MARISGVTLPPEKRIEIALTYVYGIGRAVSNVILKKANIDPNLRANQLTTQHIKKIQDIIEEDYKIGDELKRDILLNIKRLKEINSYRGSRHAKSLPARGQRTRSNSRTIRGNVRLTAGSGRRKAAEKT